MKTYTIEYYYGSYNGIETVTLSDDSDENPIDKMWRIFRRKGYMTLGMAAQGAKIIDIEEEDE